MTDSAESDADRMPDDDQLREPSTEKDAADEPKSAEDQEEAPDHHAVGVGVDDGLPGDPLSPANEDRRTERR